MLGILIAGLATFAFGGMLLIVVLGARRIEDELETRARETQDLYAAARIPRFFVVNPQPTDAVGRIDEAALTRLEQYVEAEQVLADEFVLRPSVESLYREAGRRLTVH
jgi:hypothetical protein